MPAGFVFHVFNRATERLTLFQDQADYQQFYRLLVDGSRRFPVRIISYCLMPNHWHLVVWPEADDAVSAFLQVLGTRHSLHYRWRTATAGRGHVYQGRFQGFAVQTEVYYYNLLRYVEANAAEAGLVERAEDWVWSSLFERLHDGEMIMPGPLALPDDWVVRVNTALPAADIIAIRSCERRGRPYGDVGWVAQMARRQSLEHTLRVRGRPRSPAASALLQHETYTGKGARPQNVVITLP